MLAHDESDSAYNMKIFVYRDIEAHLKSISLSSIIVSKFFLVDSAEIANADSLIPLVDVKGPAIKGLVSLVLEFSDKHFVVVNACVL